MKNPLSFVGFKHNYCMLPFAFHLKIHPENKFFLIKDFHMFSRFTKLFPHLFVNSALDYTTSRPRMITEKEAIDRML